MKLLDRLLQPDAVFIGCIFLAWGLATLGTWAWLAFFAVGVLGYLGTKDEGRWLSPAASSTGKGDKHNGSDSPICTIHIPPKDDEV